MAAVSKNMGITFDLSDEQAKALRVIAGERAVRVGGRLRGTRVDVEFIACNAPFSSCNAAFSSCNSAFSSCNSAFSKKK